jgi:hypothetical protein
MTDITLKFDPIPRLQQIAATIEESGAIADIFDSPATAAYDIECAIKEIERLRAERDEARREVCGLLVACHTDPDDEKPDPNLKHIHAGIRGWDCFKENTNA